MGALHEHVCGRGGQSGSRSFLCEYVQNSGGVNLFVTSVRVILFIGTEVRRLIVDGNDFLRDGVSRCHRS